MYMLNDLRAKIIGFFDKKKLFFLLLIHKHLLFSNYVDKTIFKNINNSIMLLPSFYCEFYWLLALDPKFCTKIYIESNQVNKAKTIVIRGSDKYSELVNKLTPTPFQIAFGFDILIH